MLRRRTLRALALLAVSAGLLIALAGCEIKDEGDDAVAGKDLFAKRCGSCHILGRAGTKGTQGPNLDEAFAQALRDGMDRETVKGVVYEQILYPSRTGLMPAKLAEGEDAEDIAEYVAFAASRSGEDTGALATVGQPAGGKKTVAAKGGMLDIPADPTGLLAYEASAATADAGALTITSKNDAQIPHNIALQGGGVNQVGKVVQDGGVSEIEVSVKPGKYTFLCTVPGHAEGGMKGTLTVK